MPVPRRTGRLLVAAAASAVLAVPCAVAAPASPGKPAAPAPTPVPVTATGTPVTGIPAPCPATHPWPAGASPAQVRARLSSSFGIGLAGPGWDDPANASLVRITWETLDAVSCTGYLAAIKRQNPSFTLNAAPISGFAWGDWGLTRAGSLTVDFGKWQQAAAEGDKGRLVRILVHELGHAWAFTPEAKASYARFAGLYATGGDFGPYARTLNENYSEVVGYYVARCAKGNPYDTGRYAAYYALVRDTVFGGRHFANPTGPVDCSGRAPVHRDPKEALDRR